MTDIEVDNQKLDLTLRLFADATGGSISKDILFMPRTVPEDYEEVIFHLTREGYLRESKYNFTITHKGRAFINPRSLSVLLLALLPLSPVSLHSSSNETIKLCKYQFLRLFLTFFPSILLYI